MCALLSTWRESETIVDFDNPAAEANAEKKVHESLSGTDTLPLQRSETATSPQFLFGSFSGSTFDQSHRNHNCKGVYKTQKS